MTDKLLPCPFCGGEAMISPYLELGNLYVVICRNCNIRRVGRSEGEAVKEWNTRANPWHTGTPTEDGKYLVQHGDDFHEVLLFKDGKFMAVEYIETTLGTKRHHHDVSETVVAWQKIEPYKEIK